MTIKRKMLLMGTGLIIALLTMAGMTIYVKSFGISTLNNYEEAAKQNDNRLSQVYEVSRYEYATVQLTLSAMDSIIDRGEGKIPAEFWTNIVERSKYLQDNASLLMDIADTDLEKQLAAEIPRNAENLIKTIKVDLKNAIEVFGKKVDNLEQAFAAIDDELDQKGEAFSSQLDQLEDRINLVQGSVTVKESLFTTRLAKERLLLAAMDSIIDRGEGRIAQERLDEINSAITSRKAALSRLEQELSNPEIKELLAEISRQAAALDEAILVNLQNLIIDSGTELAAIETAFAAFDDRIDESASAIESALHSFRNSLFEEVKEAKTAMLEAKNDAETSMTAMGNSTLGIAVVISLVVGILFYMFARSILSPTAKCLKFAETMETGDLTVRMNMRGSDEISQACRALDRVADGLQDKADIASRIAAGDLTCDVSLASDKDIFGIAFQGMIDKLNELLAQVQSAISQVDSGSQQLSSSSQSLSQCATQQAASLEEISASVTELGSQTSQNAENAGSANQMANDARDSAQSGNARMDRMITAMKDISVSSKEIEKIIKVIDEIAFQTNLLALNAAVEAARAGQHGKGFAVVAEEVRNLAARSATAAQETAQLIESSIVQVGSGVALADETGQALTTIKEQVAKVADLITEIAAASNEQAQGIGQIGEGLAQIDQVTQQNTANAEETAASAEEMSSMAAMLKELIGQFRLRGNEHNLIS